VITIIRRFYKYLLLLILLSILLPVTGILLNILSGTILPVKNILALSSVYAVISFVTLAIFLRGQTKPPDSQTLHSLVAVSLKFLLDMILAFSWFYIAKKTSFSCVIIFFVIYLTFTLFLVISILKILKYSSL
jgi:hypothetical protein